jgi:thiamine-phosphate pyrophosphorylase
MKEPCRLYLITPEKLDPVEFRLDLETALDAGDVACVQLRLKNLPDDEIERAATALMPICHERDVAFIINDRPDIAARVGADGAHIGADDGEYDAARSLLGADKLIGVSCYDSRHLAIEAAEAGADYVAFGAFFKTGTKQPRARATTDLLEWWSELMVVPCVAIGGITPGNCSALITAGADFLAVVSAVWQHPQGPGAAVKAFHEAIASAPAS